VNIYLNKPFLSTTSTPRILGLGIFFQYYLCVQYDSNNRLRLFSKQYYPAALYNRDAFFLRQEKDFVYRLDGNWVSNDQTNYLTMKTGKFREVPLFQIIKLREIFTKVVRKVKNVLPYKDIY